MPRGSVFHHDRRHPWAEPAFAGGRLAGWIAERDGRGIATRLVAEAVSHAREQGYDLVTLHAADKARPPPFGANGGLPGCRCS
ncbi:MAG: hypothetical protein WBJ62_10045 [Coriobacteriia bacterium]